LLCPVCDQDALGRVRIDSRNGLLCPECDSLWFDGEVPSFDDFHQLEDYLESKGLGFDSVMKLDSTGQPPGA